VSIGALWQNQSQYIFLWAAVILVLSPPPVCSDRFPPTAHHRYCKPIIFQLYWQQWVLGRLSLLKWLCCHEYNGDAVLFYRQEVHVFPVWTEKRRGSPPLTWPGWQNIPSVRFSKVALRQLWAASEKQSNTKLGLKPWSYINDSSVLILLFLPVWKDFDMNIIWCVETNQAEIRTKWSAHHQ